MSPLSKDEARRDSSLTLTISHYTVIKTMFMYYMAREILHFPIFIKKFGIFAPFLRKLRFFGQRTVSKNSSLLGADILTFFKMIYCKYNPVYNIEELYIVKPIATCHTIRQANKHQCTRLGSVRNLNSQASSPKWLHFC